MLALVPEKAQPEKNDLHANLFLESTILGSMSEREEERGREEGRANTKYIIV